MIGVSFSVHPFRFTVFVEDNTASVAVAVAVDLPLLSDVSEVY